MEILNQLIRIYIQNGDYWIVNNKLINDDQQL